ncbi:prolyl oligopeptidase family serine peptidase [Microbacterium aoyamense]|uniref:Prolyl oligopeptidase family serine peptidase n=1 Tax=Microbacterium aoyamense TaxID=344166 RepID=A0ABN2PW59_9MICO|nr:prolyl oligopeptidase family serine peptidase [Microbacterium aoyamense]
MTIPYGAWPSPISAAAVSAASPRIEGARFVGDDIWWGESVPEEGGRSAVRRRGADGVAHDVLPAPWSARSRVHEYGGGAWTTVDDDDLVFIEKTDQRVWLLSPGRPPRALTAAAGDVRFGGLVWQAGRLIAVRERHGGSIVPARDLVTIPLDGSGAADAASLVQLVAGSDFLAQPALSPDGTRLAWIAWDHPSMPWDRTELRVGRVEDDVVVEWTTVAGGETSPLQPIWLDDEDLLHLDDPTGRWNIERLHLSAELPERAVAPADADTGAPLWVLGARWYAVLEDARIVAVRTDGADALVLITGGDAAPIAAAPVWNTNIEDVRGTRVLVSGASGSAGPGLWSVDVDSGAVETVRGGESPWGEEWMPRPRAVSFDGARGPVHAFDYPPTNPDATAPDDELPPYVVFVHGGPTTHVGPAASPRIASFTSRGIGVLDVNYGGSSGYGRAYRERLQGGWGIVDVEDVAAAARGLAASGVADPARIAIAGGSAGGWTVLAALARTDAFAAGISRYGVGDARALAADTHDFEARYLDGLIGPLPEAEAVYIERSPLTHRDGFRVPILLLQGADDQVVPPAQSEAVRDALVERGVPHAYIVYEGEGHGFRRTETLVHAYESELAFLGAVFGFDMPGIPPIELS